MAKTSPVYVFTYGILMPSFGRTLTAGLPARRARAPGQLYDLGGFPMAVVPDEAVLRLGGDPATDVTVVVPALSAPPAPHVHGEVIVFDDPAEAAEALRIFDDIEGVDRHPPLYQRVLVPVVADGFGTVAAWMYRAPPGVDPVAVYGGRRLANGRWQSREGGISRGRRRRMPK